MKTKSNWVSFFEAAAVFVFLCAVAGLFWVFVSLLAAD